MENAVLNRPTMKILHELHRRRFLLCLLAVIIFYFIIWPVFDGESEKAVYPIKSNTSWASAVISVPLSVCQNKNLFVGVRAIPHDFKFRSRYRNTYGKLEKQLGFVSVFFIGRSANNSIQKQIEEESKQFNDIQQFDFLDTYHNITVKTGALLEFYRIVCLSNVVLMKLDDDVFWNVSHTIQFAKKFNSMKAGFAGALAGPGSKPDRNKLSRWYVSHDEFAGNEYPEYCGGSMYFARWHSVDRILKHVNEVKPFWIDDIYFCGLLRVLANESLLRLPMVYSKEEFLRLNKNYKDELPLYLHLSQKANFEVFDLLYG